MLGVIFKTIEHVKSLKKSIAMILSTYYVSLKLTAHKQTCLGYINTGWNIGGNHLHSSKFADDGPTQTVECDEITLIIFQITRQFGAFDLGTYRPFRHRKGVTGSSSNGQNNAINGHAPEAFGWCKSAGASEL